MTYGTRDRADVTNTACKIDSAQCKKWGGGRGLEGASSREDVGTSLTFSRDGLVTRDKDLHTRRNEQRRY